MFLRFPRLLRRRARPLKKSLVAGRQSLAQISDPQPQRQPCGSRFLNLCVACRWSPPT